MNDTDIVERLRNDDVVWGVRPSLAFEAADEIEQLRKDLDTRKLAIGALVHAYDNEWKVGDAMVRARKIMADGYDPWVEIEQLKTGNRLHLELAEIKDAEIERLREALEKVLSVQPIRGDEGSADIISLAKALLEIDSIANAALKEKA